jgi:succinyl-CoA synthetase alpha subunit
MNTNFKWGTHKQIVFDYLSKGKTITTRGAMIDLGIGDLQGTIRDLKEAGINIASKYISVPTRYGKNATVKEYRLSS